MRMVGLNLLITIMLGWNKLEIIVAASNPEGENYTKTIPLNVKGTQLRMCGGVPSS